MPGIDLLVSSYLTKEIKTQLKSRYLKKIERDLFFTYGMSIKIAVENFEILHNSLKSFPEIDLKNFEKSCMAKLILVQKQKDNYLVNIVDVELLNKIVDYFGDPESRKLLSAIMEKDLTIPEILSKTKILKSPAYRKIENMLLDGLVVESGKILSNNKHVSRYRCLFKEVRIVIEKNTFSLDVMIDKKDLESSSLFKFVI